MTAEKAIMVLNLFIENMKRLGPAYTAAGFEQDLRLSSRDWEVFAAHLFDISRNCNGHCDLDGCEVKSSFFGNSFEYQYHKESWREKITDDLNCDHVFIWYRSNLDEVVVHRSSNGEIKAIIMQWAKELEGHYGGERQRFRRSISAGLVRELPVCFRFSR